ncbi:MAG: chemotaxis protein CheA [Proteobacteria bacterium]|nr:chemotaxis protein CheA [Pseudomonadota bacterium]
MFISETKEHLQTMNQLIVSLEKAPADQEHIDALFRVAHSVKGMAASMGYHDIADLSHRLEDMMDLFRKGELAVNADAVDLLFEGLDALEAMVKGIEDDVAVDLDTAALLSRLASMRESKNIPADEAADPTLTPGEDESIEKDAENVEASVSPTVEKIKNMNLAFNVASSAQVPGMRAYLACKKLEEMGEVVRSEPDIESIKKGDFDNKISIAYATELEPLKVEEVLSSMPEIGGVKIELLTAESAEMLEEKIITPDLSKEEKPKISTAKSNIATSVRVSTSLLDNLINIVGEMIIARSRLYEVSKDIPSVPLKEGQRQMNNLIRDLHDRVMSVRMTSIESLMNRLPRVVRDLARKNGKKVDLQIEGKDIELDRAIVDEMGDPLIHILRNCVDHGIEMPDKREGAGKDPVGKLLIRAMREKDQVIINISDDGGGMDPEKIKKKAVEKGLIKEEQSREMDDREAFMLVCHSGLSTAEQITDVSGRGVGMDAVKNVVDSIGGSMDIDSIPGKGTNITLKLPLSVAIIQVLLIKSGNDVSAIPINKVIRTLEVQKSELKRSQKQLAVLVDEELIPLLSLRKILSVETSQSPQPLISIVVVEIRNKKVGLVVDTLVGQQEAFIKPLEPPLEWIKGLSGATIRGDGSVVFVLDVPNLF